MANKVRFNKVVPTICLVSKLALLLCLLMGFSSTFNTALALDALQEIAATTTPTTTPAAAITTTPTPVSGANIAIERSSAGELISDLNGNGLIDPGDTVRYSIIYGNSGTELLTNVMVVANYDQSVIASISNAIPVGLDDTDKITWNLGTLAPGDSLSITFEVTLKDSFPPQGSLTIENTFEISSDQTVPASTRQLVSVRVPNLKVNLATHHFQK